MHDRLVESDLLEPAPCVGVRRDESLDVWIYEQAHEDLGLAKEHLGSRLVLAVEDFDSPFVEASEADLQLRVATVELLDEPADARVDATGVDQLIVEGVLVGNLDENRPLAGKLIRKNRQRLLQSITESNDEGVAIDLDLGVGLAASEIGEYVCQRCRPRSGFLLDDAQPLENLGHSQVRVLLALVAPGMCQSEVAGRVFAAARKGLDVVDIRLLDIHVDLAPADVASTVLRFMQV